MGEHMAQSRWFPERDPKTGTCKAHAGGGRAANPSDARFFQNHCCRYPDGSFRNDPIGPVKPAPTPPAKPPAKPCADHPKWAKKGKCAKKCSGKCSKKCLKKCPRTCGVCKGETLLQSEASASWDCLCDPMMKPYDATTYDAKRCDKFDHMLRGRFHPGTQAPCKPINPD